MSKIATQEFREYYPLDLLNPHPDNPRQHDDESIEEAIDALGFNGAILVQQATGFILDGHGRVNALRKAGETTVPAFVLDVDDATAQKIMLARNRVGEKSGYDEKLLSDLLTGLAEVDDLLGTGYSADDVDDLFTQFDANIVTEPEEFQGTYAESDQDRAKRSERKAAVRRNIGLREMVLVFPQEQYDTFMQSLALVAEFASTDGASAAVLHAVVNYAKGLMADEDGTT